GTRIQADRKSCLPFKVPEGSSSSAYHRTELKIGPRPGIDVRNYLFTLSQLPVLIFLQKPGETPVPRVYVLTTSKDNIPAALTYQSHLLTFLFPLFLKNESTVIRI